ncbi:MAG: PAS domain S-box-containing protein [Gammaproteobacteria bacterium]
MKGPFIIYFGDAQEPAGHIRAQQSIQEKLSFLRQVLDNVGVFISVLTCDGTLIEVNNATLEATGIDLGEVLGKRLWDAAWWQYSEDVQNQIGAACEQGARGEVSRFDVVIHTAQGTPIPIDFMLTPLRDSAGRVTHLVQSAADISAREIATRALKEGNYTLEFNGLLFERLIVSCSHLSLPQ